LLFCEWHTIAVCPRVLELDTYVVGFIGED
jgi:hypothetical protein